ncbi:hypothetical protein I4U23_011310 [Adineta vaga]|nr:hypothetical protein I4U23_011310 [Adineta vaga]
MFYPNITKLNEKYRQFHYYLYNLTENYSIHFEIYPLSLNISYLLIYQFDTKPNLNSIYQNWILFCPSNLTIDDIYLHFINNSQTLNHHSIIYGIRELTTIDINEYCLNEKNFYPNSSMINQPRKFLSNYGVRLYKSACLYLDANNNWKSDGLIVGPLTNHYQTQCFSTYL